MLPDRPDIGVPSEREHRAVWWPKATALGAALAFGALAYGFGAGAGTLTTIAKAAGVISSPPVGTPNAPAITATVYRAQGDSLWVDGGTFAGSGSDTHSATYIWIDTTGGTFSPPKYHGDTLGAIERDSIGGNLAALDSGAMVDIIMAYEGTSGGWSAPDTLTGVTMELLTFYACSDWGTGTGTAAGIVKDTANTANCGRAGDWDGSFSVGEIEVVNATSEGLTNWPTTNALKVLASDRGDGGVSARNVQWFASDALWPITPGSSIYTRFYYQMDSLWAVTDTATASAFPDDHGTAFPNGGGSTQETTYTWIAYNDGFGFSHQVRGGPTAATRTWGVHTGNWNTVTDRFHYDADRTYRFEQQIMITSDTTFQLHVRVYDEAGVLLHSDADFHPINSTVTSLLDSTELGFQVARDSLGGWQLGTSAYNGSEMTQVTLPTVNEYFGAMAICSDWCGPYTNGR